MKSSPYPVRRDLLPAGSKVLCAVSGGADSMCMLHLLRSLEAELGITVTAAHFEHGIRGGESLRDMEFVSAYCRSNGIPFTCGRGDVPSAARERGEGIEETARSLRYEFLRGTAAETGCDLIATAHTADDSAETMLFNLARGTGAAGLRGIPAARDNIVRPIIDMTRADVERYNAENNVPHIEDSTNSSDEYSRNRIRHEALPSLLSVNPSAVKAMGRTAALLAEDDDCLNGMADAFILEHVSGDSVEASALNALPRAVASRVIRKMCPSTQDAEHIEAVLRLSGGNGLGYADIRAMRVVRDGGRVIFGAPERPVLEDTVLVPGEELVLPAAGMKIVSGFAVSDGEINNKFKNFQIKCETICGTLRVTSRRPGDRLRPSGRGCTKTLKALMLEAGIGNCRRDSIPVIRDDKGILAVYGIAADSRADALPGDRVLAVSFEQL